MHINRINTADKRCYYLVAEIYSMVALLIYFKEKPDIPVHFALVFSPPFVTVLTQGSLNH